MGNLLKLVASGASERSPTQKEGSWQNFTSLTGGHAGVPWCFAKLVHCLDYATGNELLFDACHGSALGSIQINSSLIALARSPHLHSAGLANYVAAMLLQNGTQYTDDALRLFRFAASRGHLMARQNVIAIEKHLQKQA